MNKKIALITGASGQDGSYLAQFLIKKNYKVVAADRRSSRADNWRHEYLGIENKVVYEDFDLKGIYSKALKKLKWYPKTKFKELVKIMVLEDLKRASNSVKKF